MYLWSKEIMIVFTVGLFMSGFATYEGVGKAEEKETNREAKNIIMLIPDGTGSNHVTAYRNYKSGITVFDTMLICGKIKTHSANKMITDSAAAGTALATGVKTNNGMIGMNPKGEKVNSILVSMECAGKKTGLIATSTITHATPASFASHHSSRKNEEALAPQLLEHEVDVLLGGGRLVFEKQVKVAKELGYTYVDSAEGLQQVDTKEKLLGLFADKGFSRGNQRSHTEPRLPDMTSKAIDILKSNEKGFFLMVEGSQIDWKSHDNDQIGTMKELDEFERTVRVALDFAKKDKETLVLVVPDHETGGVIIDGSTKDDDGAGMTFTSDQHTAGDVLVYAYGVGANYFQGTFDNTEIPTRMALAAHIQHSSKHMEIPIKGKRIKKENIIQQKKGTFTVTQGNIHAYLRDGEMIRTIKDVKRAYVYHENILQFVVRTKIQNMFIVGNTPVLLGKNNSYSNFFVKGNSEGEGIAVGNLYESAQKAIGMQSYTAQQEGNYVVVKKGNKQFFHTKEAGNHGLLKGMFILHHKAYIVVENSEKEILIIGENKGIAKQYDKIILP